MSPLSSKAASPQRRVSRPTSAVPVSELLSVKDAFTGPLSTPTRGRGSYRRGRGRSRGSTRGRGDRQASSVSSAIADSGSRTRSQSLLSHTDELSMDTNPNSSFKVKPEPFTPAAAVDDDRSTASTPLGDTSRPSIRRRNESSRKLDVPQTVRATNKRKRAGTTEATPDIPTPLPFNRPNHVLTSRNFPRTCTHLMNDITAHKLASLFAKPITERSAPGYHDLIYRPQDLKSIKSAISAGSRAVAAAAELNATLEEGASPAQGPIKGAATLWIERTEDVVPPKAIVNSAQLEKEICRMFANAVMFNPDPKRGFGPAFRTRSKTKAESEDEEEETELDDGGGFVRDTREMFETVEKAVTAWRAAEKVGEDGKARGREERKEEDEVDELAAEDEERSSVGRGSIGRGSVGRGSVGKVGRRRRGG